MIDLREKANVGAWFEAMLHKELTVLADYRYADGQLTRDERKALSSAVGKALDAFRSQLEEIAPGLYQRSPYTEAPEVAMPVGEADETAIEGEFVQLVERAVREDGTVKLRLIQPGWGTSGYYNKKVLQRDVPRIFPQGTMMFWDHPTEAEESQRPEGSLKDLAAVLVSTPKWDKDGMYAEAKVFGQYREALEELAPHIGVSIRALGRSKPGSAEGRKGPIIEEIAVGRSVDFVTTPGAGGRVAELFEAARSRTDRTGLDEEGRREVGLSERAGGGGLPGTTQQEAGGMNEVTALQEANAALQAQMTALQEAQARLEQENARLREDDLLRRAEAFVAQRLATVEMPEITRRRLAAELAASPVVLEADRYALDEKAFGEAIAEKAKAELAYLAEAVGRGQVRGMGPKPDPAPPADVQTRMAEAFKGLGLSEGAAKVAANGR